MLVPFQNVRFHEIFSKLSKWVLLTKHLTYYMELPLTQLTEISRYIAQSYFETKVDYEMWKMSAFDILLCNLKVSNVWCCFWLHQIQHVSIDLGKWCNHVFMFKATSKTPHDKLSPFVTSWFTYYVMRAEGEKICARAKNFGDLTNSFNDVWS